MTLRFVMWNVQHGSAALVQTPNGKNIVIDLGASDDFSPLKHIKSFGIHTVDCVIITHPHMDHIDDILNFDALSPKVLIRPSHLSERDIMSVSPPINRVAEEKIQKYFDIARRYNGTLSPGDDVRVQHNLGGVSIKVFTPSQSSKGNLNNHSVVTVLEYCGVKILVPGDNESPSWQELLGLSDFVSAIENTHVLVAAHHGRESGFHRPLFDHISPFLTLVSDGRVVDTSVTARYTEFSQGWNVDKRSGGQQKRYCVTTRNDGIVEVEVNPIPNQVGSLKVTVD